MPIPGMPLGGSKRKFAHGQQRGRNLLAAATETNSAKKPTRVSKKRLLWSATRTAGRSPSTVPTPDLRTADVASLQRPAPGASPAAAATPRAPPAADAAARRMSFAPPSPATHAAKPQTHASATPATRPTPPRGAFPTPRAPGGPSAKSPPRAVTLRAPPSVSEAERMSSDASAPPKSSSRSSTALPNAACSANAERGASVRAEPEAPEAPGAAPASAAGFGPPVAANPFAAAAKAAARTSAHRAEAGPAGTPEVRGAPRLGAALEPRVAPARRAPPSRVPGLVNLGNTCYLAATAQLLCGLDAFAGDVDGLPDAYLNANARGSAPEGAGGDARDAPSFDGVAGAARDLVRAREAHAARFDDAATRASATAALVPARLKRAVQRRRPRYEGYEQHDAHEFLCDALDALAEEVADAERSERPEHSESVSGARTDARRSIGSLACSSEWVPLHRTRCPTRRAFTGASAVTLTCETCGDASTSVESFRHLSLEIPPSETSETSGTSESAPLELQALIARCFASETVERRCARAGCGGTRAAMARRLLRAPRALLVHLKRFRAEDASRETCGDASFLHPSVSGDSRRGYVGTNAFAPPRLTKDARPVSLPETLTLAPFADAAVRGPPPPIASAGTRGGDGRSAGFADSDLSADEAAAATRTYAADDSAAGEAARAQLASYRLAGVVSHLGASMRRGHYVASARVDSGGEDENGTAAKRWMSFDDERASFAGSPAGSASAAGDWYVAAFECEAAR